MVEIVGKSYKQIQIREDVDQLEFLEATEEAWDYITGVYHWFDKESKDRHGNLGLDRTTSSWPDHKECGGMLTLRPGYQIVGMEHVRKGNWGLHIDDLFYTNIHFLLTEHKGVGVDKYGLFLGNALGHFPMFIARHSEYDKMVEITQFASIGFSFCIIEKDGSVTAWNSSYIAETLGINVLEWDLKWPTINLPA